MPRITVKSPDDIRREVNSVKHHAAATANPRLKRRAIATDLTIDFGQCPRERVLQASDLATLISCAPGGRLESLSLEHVKIEGDFGLVLQALRSSGPPQHLKSFSSYACRLRDSREDMMALGEALATLPRLQGVSLGLSYMKHQPAWKILTPIVQNCKQLIKIFVNGFYAPDRDDEEANREVVEFFQACAASKSIKRLLCLPMLGRCFGTPSVLQALGQVIRQNTSLQTLELYILNGSPVRHLAEDLQHNNTLTRLALTGRHNSESTQEEMQAFYHALRDHNYTLQELHIEPWNHGMSAQLDFELSLNRMGRNKLLNQGATTDEWMEAIANKDDISAVFYFLRKNPNLCDPKMWTGAQEEEEEKDVYSPAKRAALRWLGQISDNDEDEIPEPRTAVVSPESAASAASTTSATTIGSMDSPLAPRVLHREDGPRRKRSRDQMEQDDDNDNTPEVAAVAKSSPSMAMRVATTTAYTAAVFCAGYWFGGAAANQGY